MVVFELGMPEIRSWNGRWSGGGRLYAKTRPDRKVPKKLIGND